MEDAVSLSVVLQRGTQPDEVPERLRLYETFRMERAHRVQEYSRLAGRDLGGEKALDSKSAERCLSQLLFSVKDC
jgi:2-polyprenyl-6-methoxyphenol hydroxylase-like FAD-dependent oxidoreductase